MSMEFMLRLFDSFLRERIPCEKQKNKRHHISIGVACVRFQALSVLSALAGRLFIPYPLGGMDRMGLLAGVAAEDNRYLSTGCGAVRHSVVGVTPVTRPLPFAQLIASAAHDSTEAASA